MILAMVQEYLMPLTPSADIPLPVSSIPKPADIDLVGKYVVVPYGPQFHIAKVQEQYDSTMYIECVVLQAPVHLEKSRRHWLRGTI